MVAKSSSAPSVSLGSEPPRPSDLSDPRDTLNAATHTTSAYQSARPAGPVTEPRRGGTTDEFH